MDCSDVRPLLGLERDMPAELRLALRQHVAHCAGCAHASRQAEETSRILGALTPAEVRPSQLTVRAIQARLAVAPLAPSWHRRPWLTFAAGAVVMVLIGLIAFGGPALGAGQLARLVAAWWPGAIGPRLYLATDRDPSRNLGSPQVTILDPQTLAPLFSTTAGDDAIVTRDQKRLYVASTSQITAVDVANVRELWRSPLDHRVAYIGGAGPSSLGLPPDGSALYVFSYDSSDSSAPFWLQVFDTATGRLRPNTIRLLPCVDSAPRLLSPGSGDRMYVVCSFAFLAINTRTQAVEQTTSLVALPGQMSDAVLSRDERSLYLLTSTRQLVTLDVVTGALQPFVAVARPADVSGESYYAALALSADGETLLVLETVQSQPGTDVAADLYFYNTHTWALLRQLRVDRPLQSTTLAFRPDGRTIYSASGPVGDMPFGADTLVEIDAFTGRIASEHERPGEHILRMWLMPGAR